ncbi:hypothetical protein [Mangrovibrevibacter kandeliae]|uniref:hypothetical protein n=1 Tax=Mangrovibrevibacter kandeliae TaxID=2968473 RepID=UPI002119790D|nr:hypothetical protein [Aurantimonas sp. CSK15Z-1]MCQ8781733.1 hypothetical protein [Aurantimonas sp. CSK15Z-1]
MALRVWAGPGFFRVAKPGYQADSTNDFDLMFAEYRDSLAAGVKGMVTVPATSFGEILVPDPGVITFYILSWAYPLPWPNRDASMNVSFKQDLTSIRMYNSASGAKTVKYILFRTRSAA